jgi:hypothetical protein
MDPIARYVLTVLIEENMIFTISFNSQKLTFVLCFSSTPISLGFFKLSSTCLVHLKVGTCSLNIMFNPLHPRTILAKSGFWEGTCASMLF